MTVQENITKVTVTGPLAVGDVIPIPFQYINETDIKVEVDGAAYIYNVDYEVTLQSVEIKTAVEGSVSVTVYRDTPLDQQAEFPQNNKFNSAKMNEALDKLCMVQQEQQETIDRSMRVPISVGVENFNPEIPTPVAGRTFRIKEDLSGFEYSEYDPDQAYRDTEEFKNQAGNYAAAAQTSATNAASSASTATQKANEAAASATTATEQADIATAKTEEVYTTYQEAMTAIAGAEQSSLETISTATTQGITSIGTATNDAIRSVNSAGISNVSNVNLAGQDQLHQLQEETAKAKDYAQKAIGWDIEYEPEGAEDTLVFTDRTPEEIEEATNYVEDARDEALASITSSKTSAISTIDSAQATALNNISSASTTGVHSISTAKNSAITSINTATTTGVNTIDSAKAEALSAIADKTSEEVTTLRNETATCITNVQATGAAAMTEINATISDAETSIEASRQVCEEMAQRATLGWLIGFEDDCLVFTSVQESEG